MGNQASGFAYDIGEPVGTSRTHWQVHKGKKKVCHGQGRPNWMAVRVSGNG